MKCIILKVSLAASIAMSLFIGLAGCEFNAHDHDRDHDHMSDQDHHDDDHHDDHHDNN